MPVNLPPLSPLPTIPEQRRRPAPPPNRPPEQQPPRDIFLPGPQPVPIGAEPRGLSPARLAEYKEFKAGLPSLSNEDLAAVRTKLEKREQTLKAQLKSLPKGAHPYLHAELALVKAKLTAVFIEQFSRLRTNVDQPTQPMP